MATRTVRHEVQLLTSFNLDSENLPAPLRIMSDEMLQEFVTRASTELIKEMLENSNKDHTWATLEVLEPANV